MSGNENEPWQSPDVFTYERGQAPIGKWVFVINDRATIVEAKSVSKAIEIFTRDCCQSDSFSVYPVTSESFPSKTSWTVDPTEGR